jgi:hypothetical protein
MFAPRTSEELVAACSIQGRVPFNHKSRALDSGSAYLPIPRRRVLYRGSHGQRPPAAGNIRSP